MEEEEALHLIVEQEKMEDVVVEVVLVVVQQVHQLHLHLVMDIVRLLLEQKVVLILCKVLLEVLELTVLVTGKEVVEVE